MLPRKITWISLSETSYVVGPVDGVPGFQPNDRPASAPHEHSQEAFCLINLSAIQSQARLNSVKTARNWLYLARGAGQMAYHIVNIDTANCSLSCRDGQLICKTSDGERKLPLEDVACIVVTSFSASIHSHLLIEAAKHGVGLVLCKAFKPVSILMPANRSTDTILSRAVLELAPRVRQNLWQKTVDAKCQNQFALAAHIAPTDTQLELLNSKPSAKSRTKKPLAPGRSGISTHVR